MAAIAAVGLGMLIRLLVAWTRTSATSSNLLIGYWTAAAGQKMGDDAEMVEREEGQRRERSRMCKG